MRHNLLHVTGLSKRYGEFFALRDASFSVDCGEIVGLIGPNGAGKTTLFECVAGLLAPTSGVIAVQGNEIAPDRRKRHLYLVPDGIRPWPDQTVHWTLRFAAGVHGQTGDTLHRVCEQFSLPSLSRSRLAELSKGEHRRVMLALGVLARQPLLMLDEPFDGLDMRQTRQVMTLLRDEARAGRALFLSIHQLSDAARVCDRLILLSSGRIVGSGTVAELQASAGTGDATLEDIFLALT